MSKKPTVLMILDGYGLNSNCDQKFVLPLFDFIILLSLTKFVCIVSEIQRKVIIGVFLWKTSMSVIKKP